MVTGGKEVPLRGCPVRVLGRSALGRSPGKGWPSPGAGLGWGGDQAEGRKGHGDNRDERMG